MSTETTDLHPAQATAAAVAQGAIDAREEAIRIVQGKTSKEPAKGQPDVKATPSEPDAGESDASDDPAPPTEGDPKPETDRVSRRIAAALRLEQRSARERAEIAGERAQLEQTRQSVAEQLKAIEAREAKFKLIESDPVKAFEELGIDLRDFLDRLSGEHNPVTLKFKELEKRLDAERAERERIEQESKRREQELQFHAAKEASTKAFISHVADNADQYPHLTDEFTPDEIAARGWEVAAQHAEEYHRRFGEYPDDSVIAEYLEAQAKARAEQRSAWRARLKKSPSPSQGTASASALKPRTLTNSTASQRASAPRTLSDRDAREEAMKIIQLMHAKGA